jgi:hypothetical protein
MRLLRITLFLLVIVASPPASSQYKRTADCWCPQSSDGWTLYADSNPVPDFMYLDQVEVREILICPHGIHFFFIAKQNGQEFFTSLIIVKPTLELYLSRKPPRNAKTAGLTLAERVKQGLERYECVLSGLKRVLGDSFGENVLIPLDNELSRPRIYPKKGLIMEWNGAEMEIRGYLDVYLSMLS